MPNYYNPKEEIDESSYIAHPREESSNYHIKNKIQAYAKMVGDQVKVRDL
ncbi:MAG: hypothetical protein ACP5DQ_03365 [Bacteroidales bacterium]